MENRVFFENKVLNIMIARQLARQLVMPHVMLVILIARPIALSCVMANFTSLARLALG